MRTIKSWRDGQKNLAQGTKTKELGKTKNKNRVAQKKRRQSGRKQWNYGVGFVKQVGFKPGVKEKGVMEWLIERGRSDGWRK